MLDKDARRENITAARAVADLVKSTLGPKGMDKMIVDTEKNVVLTNKSATILSGISTNHPAVKIIIEAVKTQEKELGDGTTALAFLIGELLWNAEKLFDQGVNAPPILKGYDIAGKMALDFLEDISSSMGKEDLEKIAFSVLRGKLPEEDARYLAGIAVKAVETGKEEENILVTYRSGGRVRDTRLVDGVVIDLGKRVHPSMPKVVKNASIVLTDREFDVKKMENVKVELGSASKMKAFLRYKEAVLKKAVEMIKASGANVLLCNKNIDDLAMFYLAKAGILGVRDVEKDVLEMLANATGGKILTNVKDVNPSVLGHAEFIEESKIGLEELMYITGCRHRNAATILIRAGTEKGADELRKNMESLVSVLLGIEKDRSVIPGGGAAEIEIARKLREYARKVHGKEQLAIDAYADSLESIPKAVATNSGRNPIDVIASLREKHEKGDINSGLDVTDGTLGNIYRKGILDSLKVKKHVFKSASEVACMILRIDDILLSEREGKTPAPQPAPPSPSTPPGAMDFPAKKGKIDFGELMK